MSIPLEDNVADIVGKAQRGLAVSDSQVAERSGISAEKMRKLRGGEFDRDVTIQTKIPRRKVSKAVILTQRITTISIRCPDTHACAPLSVGGTSQVWSDGFDASGLRDVVLHPREQILAASDQHHLVPDIA